MLVSELKKAFSGPLFISSTLIMLSLALVAAFDAIQSYASIIGDDSYGYSYEYTSSESCFIAWIGVGTWGSGWASGLFFYALPLISAVPFSLSALSEYQSGYIAQPLIRGSHAKYLASKTAAVFLSAAAVVAIPLLINLLIVACVFPAYTPSAIDVIYTGVYEDDLYADLLYSEPVLFVAARIATDCTLCGLWAISVMALGFIVRIKTVTLLAPYLFLLFIEYVNHNIFILCGNVGGIEVSLFNLLQTVGYAYPHSFTVLVIEAALMLSTSFFIVALASKGDVL